MRIKVIEMRWVPFSYEYYSSTAAAFFPFDKRVALVSLLLFSLDSQVM